MATAAPLPASGRCSSATTTCPVPRSHRRRYLAMTTARTRVEIWFSLIWGVLLRLALIAAFAYTVYRVRFVIVTVLMAVFLALGIAPLVEALDRPLLLPFLRPGTRRVL